MEWIAISVGGAAVIAVLGYFYVGVVRQPLKVASEAMGKPALVANAQGFFASLDAKLTNWKTVILAWIAGLSQVFSFLTTDVIQGWQQLPWANVFDAKVANWITIACALLIPVVHAQGIKKAALAPPIDEGQ